MHTCLTAVAIEAVQSNRRAKDLSSDINGSFKVDPKIVRNSSSGPMIVVVAEAAGLIPRRCSISVAGLR